MNNDSPSRSEFDLKMKNLSNLMDVFALAISKLNSRIDYIVQENGLKDDEEFFDMMDGGELDG